jgi:hypothetical protein
MIAILIMLLSEDVAAGQDPEHDQDHEQEA